MDAKSEAIRYFEKAREENPAIKSAIVSVVDGVDHHCFFPEVLETSEDVAKKQVQEWDMEGALAHMADRAKGNHWPCEVSVWKVSFQFPNSEPVARLMSILVKE